MVTSACFCPCMIWPEDVTLCVGDKWEPVLRGGRVGGCQGFTYLAPLCVPVCMCLTHRTDVLHPQGIFLEVVPCVCAAIF